MRTMSKRERLEAAFHGLDVDRPPVALWRHWPGDDQRAEDLAAAQVRFQRDYDFDFIKVTPSSSFCVEDWGVESRFVGGDEGSRKYLSHVIHEPEDWARLEPLDPSQGALARQLRCLKLVREAVGEEVPFIQTIFNPLSMARYLAGDDLMRVHLRKYPDAFEEGLNTLTETAVRFVREAVKTGAAGIFLAVQAAQFTILSPAEYETYGKPSDLEVLAAAEGSWFRLLHLHGSDVMFDLLSDYPAEVVNWHDRETPPTLAEGLTRFSGALCGGLRQIDTMLLGSPDDVRAEARDAIEQTGGKRFILGTGCVTPITSPTSNIRAAREIVDQL